MRFDSRAPGILQISITVQLLVAKESGKQERGSGADSLLGGMQLCPDPNHLPHSITPQVLPNAWIASGRQYPLVFPNPLSIALSISRPSL